jgi:hypothetical protein
VLAPIRHDGQSVSSFPHMTITGQLICSRVWTGEAAMRLWYWIVRIFRRRTPETEIHNREELRKWNLDEATRQAQRWIGGSGSGR